jgi:replicative DNA helicase
MPYKEVVMKPLPHNLDVEKYIIGCLLIDKQEEVYLIKETDFHNLNLQTIFKIINWMHDTKKPIDSISVSDYAKKKIPNALDMIIECTESVTTTTLFNTHLQKLKLYAARRDLVQKARQLENIAYDSEHELSIDLKNDALEQLANITVQEIKNDKCQLGDILAECICEIEEDYNRKDEMKLFTGFEKFDRITAGFHRQEMTIIAARPGIGKTAFATQLMLNLAKKGNYCLLISREMSKVQICKRLMANVSQLDGNKLRVCKSLNDNDWKEIAKAQAYLSGLSEYIAINDELSTIQQIRTHCRLLRNKEKLDILFVDYLGLLKSAKKCESRRVEIEEISRQLKEMSLEFKIPIVSLHQLNRDSANAEPEIHHLRESGAIEQDSDNVFLLHSADEDKSNPKSTITVIIGKQRNGPTGKIHLQYYKNSFKFYD